MTLAPVTEGSLAQCNLITKVLPQIFRSFISDRYPYGMEAQEYIANTALGQMEKRSC